MGNRHHHHYHSTEDTRQRLQNEGKAAEMAHQRQMREMELRYQQEQQKMKNERIKDSTDGIKQRLNEVKIKLASDEKDLIAAKTSLGEVTEELKALDAELNETTIQEKFKTDLEAPTRRRDEAKQSYQECYDEISQTITKTGQAEANVLQFLGYMKDLINATASTKAATNLLEIEMKTNGELLKRYCDSKLAVEMYFKNNEPILSQYIELLAKEDMKYLDDLTCADEEEFTEDIIGTLIREEEEKNEEEDVDDAKEEDGANAMKQWFKKLKLSQYYDAFVEAGCDELDDLNDEETFTDEFLKDDLGITKKIHRGKILKNIKKLFAPEPEPDPLSKLPKRHVSKLKAICLKPKETWSKFQVEKIAKNKKDLLAISPVLSEFFGRLDGTVKKAQQMLEYPQSASKAQFNEEQMKAIKLVADQKEDNDDAMDEEDEKAAREKMGPQSECKIYSESDDKWYDATVIKVTNDKEGEWLNVAYRSGKEEKEPTLKQIQRYAKEIKPKPTNVELYKECRALTKATVSEFHVMDSLLEEYKTNDTMELEQDPRVNALQTVGGGVENNCVLIFKNQAKIRQSVMLANDILSLKPANMKDQTTVKLWQAVDRGVINIFNSALDMIKVSAEYFSFFLKFRQSFGYFMSCYQENEDASMLVASEYLQKDIRNFVEFQKQFTKQVKALGEVSSGIIAECVEQAIGDTNFKSRQEQQEALREKYEFEDKELRKARDKIHSELDLKWKQKFKLSGEKQKSECLTKILPVSIEGNKQYISDLEERLKKLELSAL
eukprot:467099_1